MFGRSNTARQPTAAGSLRLSHAQRNGVIPIVYGTTRIESNLLDFQNFQSFQALAQNVGKGKGGLVSGGKSGKNRPATVTEYTCAFILGICQGPIASYGQLWYDKFITSVSGENQPVSTINLGTDGQAPDGFWSSNITANAIGYSGTATLTWDYYVLGPTPTMPNFSVEIAGIANGSGVNGQDADPSAVIYDYLTNTRYGALFPPANVDAVFSNASIASSYASYVRAMGLWISPAFTTQSEAQQELDTITKLTNAEIVWSSGKLKIIPRGESPVTGQITQNASWTITLTGGDANAGDNYQIHINDPVLGTANVSYGAFQNEHITDVGNELADMLFGVIAKFGIIIVNVTSAETPLPPAAPDTAVNQNNVGIVNITMFQDPPTGNTVVTVSSAATGGTIAVSTTAEGGVGQYTPNTQAIYSLGEDDWIVQQSSAGMELGPNPGGEALRFGATPITGGFTGDPVHVLRSSPADAYNRLSVECLDRAAWYNASSVPVFDQVGIDLYGLHEQSAVNGKMFQDPYVAYQSAQLLLQRGLLYRNTYHFTLGWKYILLEPMDLVQITDARLGLNALTVRITAVEEDQEGALSITAEDWLGAYNPNVLYPSSTFAPSTNPTIIGIGGGTVATRPTQINTGYNQNQSTQVSDINAPIIFEPPAPLLSNANALEIWIAVSNANTGAGGAQVWMSTDGSSYASTGLVAGNSSMGVTTAVLPTFTGSDPDQTDTLPVDLTESRGTLNTVSNQVASNYVNLAYVGPAGGGGELFSFETAALTAANKYTLSILYRGGFGTTIASHASGSAFTSITGAVARIPIPSSLIGRQVFFKLLAFNAFGAAAQSLADVPAYSYTVTGAGLASVTVDITGSVTGKPAASAILQSYVFTGPYTIPINMEGSYASPGTVATATAIFPIKKNGTQFGTMSFGAGVPIGGFIAASATSFVSGDTLTVVAPSTQDATLANIGWNIFAKNP